MKVMSEEWRVASDTQQRGESDRPPLDKGGLQGGFSSVDSTYIGPPPHPQPLSRAGERGADALRTDARTVDPPISRHSPLVTRHSRFVTRHLQILALILLSKHHVRGRDLCLSANHSAPGSESHAGAAG